MSTRTKWVLIALGVVVAIIAVVLLTTPTTYN
jgi:hypothetical protein